MGSKVKRNYVYRLIRRRLIRNVVKIGTWGSVALTGGLIALMGYYDDILYYCMIHLGIVALPCLVYLTCCISAIRETYESSTKERKFAKKMMIAGIITFVIGAPIALGIHFGIFYPLKIQEWESATCTLKSFDTAGDRSSIKLIANVQGYNLTGCGGATGGFRNPTAEADPVHYPYSYSIIDYHKIQIPGWHCSCPHPDYCPAKESTFACLVRRDGGSFDDLNKRPKALCPPSITDSSYLEVIWGDDAPYYDKDSEVANVVTSFFLFIVGFFLTTKYTFQYITLKVVKRRYRDWSKETEYPNGSMKLAYVCKFSTYYITKNVSRGVLGEIGRFLY